MSQWTVWGRLPGNGKVEPMGKAASREEAVKLVRKLDDEGTIVTRVEQWCALCFGDAEVPRPMAEHDALCDRCALLMEGRAWTDDASLRREAATATADKLGEVDDPDGSWGRAPLAIRRDEGLKRIFVDRLTKKAATQEAE